MSPWSPVAGADDQCALADSGLYVVGDDTAEKAHHVKKSGLPEGQEQPSVDSSTEALIIGSPVRFGFQGSSSEVSRQRDQRSSPHSSRSSPGMDTRAISSTASSVVL